MKQHKIGFIFFSMLFIIACSNKSEKQTYKPIETLGRFLFYDTYLSINHTKSCGSCHAPQFAFTDGYRRSVSPLGENLLHNSPSLLNTSENNFYDWANPTATDYIKQMQRPLYNHQPIELGLDLHWDEVSTYLSTDSTYRSLFPTSFPSEKNLVTKQHIELAIASYVKTLNSTQSAYDQYINGTTQAMSASAILGLHLFESKELACAQCHKPPSFTVASTSQKIDEVYVNIGLYNIDNKNQYPADDNGLFKYTNKKEDQGKYKIPSLRNVAINQPYMHDGSITSLEEVIEIYARGGRNTETGEYIGDGKGNIYKHALITGFKLSPTEKRALIDFLASLTDTSYLSNEHYLNPFRNK